MKSTLGKISSISMEGYLPTRKWEKGEMGNSTLIYDDSYLPPGRTYVQNKYKFKLVPHWYTLIHIYYLAEYTFKRIRLGSNWDIKD